MRELLGKEIARKVEDGQVIGVGTGTTVESALREIGSRVSSEKYRISVVPTSYQTAWLCEKLGFTVLSPCFGGKIAFGFDGADAVDPKRRAIKGKGGALLQEKILAARCEEYFIIVDENKMVDALSEACPIPVEVVPAALGIALAELRDLGAKEMTLREGSGKHGPVITEGGNLIVDAAFPKVSDTLERDIKSIVGVVESGLFSDYATAVYVATTKGVKKI